MASEYFLLFKTAQAEFRAWEAFSSKAKERVFPIVELTRGRKIPKSGADIDQSAWPTTKGIYNFNRNIEKVRDTFSGSSQIILDVTREESLSCYEIDALSTSDDGYKNWVDFMKTEAEYFQGLIPTLLINPSESENMDAYKSNLTRQLDALMSEFSGVAYRASILLDPEFLYDLILLEETINRHLDAGKRFVIELDHEFIRPGTSLLLAARTIGIIEKITKILPMAELVILSTSFPKFVTDLGDEEEDSFPLEEVFLHEEIAKNKGARTVIHYGDYGSINPIRNDQIIMRSGWRPRIDFPTSEGRIFYYREKREKDDEGVTNSYASHYASVANNVVNDPSFEKLQDCWGVTQIESAAAGHPPGLSPSFWISVRMEIHMRQQVNRLNSI
jgi:hypothetical protein